MLPLKETLIVCAIIASVQMIPAMPSICRQFIYVDSNGRMLLDAIDPRRTSDHFDAGSTIDKNTLKWYRSKYDVSLKSIRNRSAAVSDLPQPNSDENEIGELRLSDSEFELIRLPTL